ncbi:MAG TPA: AAA family ATPase [Pirellulales bacterium]|jgi:predicted ATPase with chaperone activity|nr:AAA family ATPase [Pirellulales bacterium]
MADRSSTVQELLSRLTKSAGEHAGADSWAAVEATTPDHTRAKSAAAAQVNQQRQEKLNQLLGRIADLTGQTAEQSTAASSAANPAAGEDFVPLEPTSYHEAMLSESEVEALVLKFLLSRGDAAGRDIAEQLKLPFALIEELLRQLKQDQLVFHRGSAAMNDYQFQLAELGRERARRLSEHCTYFGSAPVHLKHYVASVQAQSLMRQRPTVQSLREAFDDLLISQKMMGRLGPAINSGRGLFLYGAAGNGKTSIAERITKAFGQYIWIPRSIGVDGEIIRLYDPSNHEVAPLENQQGLLNNKKIDSRWIRIRRPTIVVGGELTMDNLEVTLNTATGISEAPMQMKSNCGTLVIDDFGRQRMSIDELLNRWIMPLEKRYDYLNLASGKKIQVPFDQLIIFSTNLEPKDLVDDAFLRRIPYKIEVVDPTEDEFRELFKLMCPRMGFEYREETVNYVLEKHYKQQQRPFRCCQPRDLLLQVRNYCSFHDLPLTLSNEYFDFAVENYFAVM